MTAGALATNPHDSEPVKVEDKAFNFYSKFLTPRTPQGYGITVREGQTTNVKIRANEDLTIKIYMPDGEVKEYKNEKQYALEFHAAGEYVIQLSATEISKYTLLAVSK